MAQYTPNFNLYEPDSTDDFADFRTEFNNNMNIIDQNLGGGGGSGGHTIIDENGQSMTQRTGLEFTGNVSVTDDSVNDKTIVDILGGGGNVYGAFIDTNRVLATHNSSGGSAIPSYTALEDCFVAFYIFGKNSQTCRIYVDSIEILTIYFQGDGVQSPTLYLKKGQTLSFSSFDYWSFHYEVYGLTQGTNGIYAPVIYSDNERVIGVWRDNKPLYAKTLNPSVNVGSNTINHGIANLEKCVRIYGVCKYNNTSEQLPLPCVSTNTAYNIACGNVTSTTYLVDVGTGFSSIQECYVTLFYTKTTDVAGSGNWNTDGVPTVHYSTSEQVIGTWINGKPLYEITLTHSGALIVDNSFANDIGSLVDVDQFIGCEGYFRRTNANGLMYSLNGGTRPEGSADNKVSARYYNGNVQVAVNGYNDIEYIALTVRYTKTTD